MGRVVGDGACFALVTDIAVAPERQDDGLGTEVMTRLVAWCEVRLDPSCHISLICDPRLATFYERHGFSRIQGMERFADRDRTPLGAAAKA